MEAPNTLIDHSMKDWLYKKGKKKLNLVLFSEDTGVKITSTWFYFRSERRWPAEAWIRALVYFGIAKINHENCSIVINFPKNAETRKSLKRLVSKD